MTDHQTESEQRVPLLLVIAWLWVALPLAYGLYELIRKVVQLFS